MRPRLRYSHSAWSTDRRTRSSQLFWFALLCLQTVLIGVGYVLIHSALQISQQTAPSSGSSTPAAGAGFAAPAGTAQQAPAAQGSGSEIGADKADGLPEGQVEAAEAAKTAGIAAVQGGHDGWELAKGHPGKQPLDGPSAAIGSHGHIQQHADQAASAASDPTTAPALPPAARDDPAVAAFESYLQSIRPTWTQNWHEAVARQARPTAKEAGLLHGMVKVAGAAAGEDVQEAVRQRIAHVNSLMDEAHATAPCGVAISTTWAGNQASLHTRLLPWLAYHAALGVGTVYLLLDSSDKALLAVLATLNHVRLVHVSEVAEVAEVPEQLQPGDAGVGAMHVLTQAQQEGLQWLIHLETHELMHPGHPSFSLAAELCSTAATVPAVSFGRLEAVPEAAGMSDLLQQVTLFRAPARMPEQQLWSQLLKQGRTQAHSALRSQAHVVVRLDALGLRVNDAHVITGDPSPCWVTPNNPAGTWVPQPARVGSFVLHYGQALQGADCSSGSSHAAVQDVFWAEHLLSEGSPVACGQEPGTEDGQEGWCNLRGIEQLKEQLLQAGLLLRLHAPQQLRRGLERLLQQQARMQHRQQRSRVESV